jgi:shikimate dehydrogenase
MNWRLGVAGSPIAHSLSPQLHVVGLALAGLQGMSQRYELGDGDATVLREMMGTSVDAMSITMPLKSVAAALCDDLDVCATSLGVVNSLLWRDDRLLGAATDGPGFIDSLHGVFDLGVQNLHVVVLGAGGAARAIVDSLVHQGAHSIALLGRSEANVRQIVSRHPNVVDHMVLYRPVDVIVNTTPVQGRASVASVMQGVSRDTIAVDITYEPRMSPWLALHAQYGCRHTNGLAMLAYQAARQMNWWWGSDLDGGSLLKALA